MRDIKMRGAAFVMAALAVCVVLSMPRTAQAECDCMCSADPAFIQPPRTDVHGLEAARALYKARMALRDRQAGPEEQDGAEAAQRQEETARQAKDIPVPAAHEPTPREAGANDDQ